MAEGEKTLKFRFEVDQTSFNKAMGQLDQLISKVSKLVEMSQRVNMSFGGVNGGGGSGTSFTSRSAPSGTGSNPTAGIASQMRMGAGVGGITDNLTKSVQATSQIFKLAAEGSKSSLKVMSDALRQEVQASSQQIEKLERALRGLGGTYDRLKREQGRGLNPGNFGAVQGAYVDTANQLVDARSGMDRLRGQQANAYMGTGQLQYFGSGSQAGFRAFAGMGSASPLGGLSSGTLTDRMKVNWNPTLGNIGGAGGALRTGANALGLGFLGAGAGLAAGVGAAVGGYSYLTNAMYTNDMANVQYKLNQPMAQLQHAATMGNIFGGLGQSIASGSMSTAIGQQLLNKDPAAMRQLHDIQARRTRDRLKAGVEGDLRLSTANRNLQQNSWEVLKELGNHLSTGNAFSSKDYSVYQSQVGRAGERGNFHFVMDSEPGKQTQYSLALQEDNAKRASETAQDYQQALQAKIAANPRLAASADRIFNSTGRNIGLGRIGGMTNTYNPKTGSYSFDEMEANLMGQGRSLEELAGARRSLGMAAGWGARGALGLRATSMGEGGFGGTDSIFGIGAQFGGGTAGGKQMINNIQGLIGRGGVDTVAASGLFEHAAGAMASGGFEGMTGNPLMQNLAAMTYTGSPTGDMRQASIVQQGMGAYNQSLSGSVDPLQQAFNVSAANRAMPGMSWMAKHATMGLSGEALKNALASGGKEMPEDLKNLGVNYSQLRSYAKYQAGSVLSRANASFLSGDAKKAFEDFRSSGNDVNAYLRSRLSGKDLKSAAKRNAALSPLATIYGQTAGISTDAAKGMLTQLLDNDLLPTFRGHGAHGGGLGTREKIVTAGQKRTKQYSNAFEAANQSTIEGALQSSPELAEEDYKSGSKLAKMSESTAQLVTELDNITLALKRFEMAVEKVKLP